MLQAPLRRSWEDLLQRRYGCNLCPEWAEALWDGEPVCLHCADLLLERLEAIARVPAFRSELPSLSDRVPGL